MPQPLPSKFQTIIDELSSQYIDDPSHRPWIIGFSGGKDSTVLLTLVWMALNNLRKKGIPLHRKIYVVCNDTLVENPIITDYVEDVLSIIQKEVTKQDLPIIVKQTKPKLDETFWINVIGRGYPVPNNIFRWCTDRLKIRPTSNFLREQINEQGQAVVLLGTRYAESSSRAQSIRKHETKGQNLSPHPNSPNTMTYAPIKTLALEEIWYIINAIPSPWGYDNSILHKIYADASADDYECPTVVTSKEHKSCGQSRFGCWTCTVVSKDKSMSALIENGQFWLTPLLKFRNQLQEERNKSEFRNPTRRGGQYAISDDGRNQGNYTMEYRQNLLKELLEVQQIVRKMKPSITLISSQELAAIQTLWNMDLFHSKKVSDIYGEVTGTKLKFDYTRGVNSKEQTILKQECKEQPEIYNTIMDLLAVQETKAFLLNNYRIRNDLEKVLDSYAQPDDY